MNIKVTKGLERAIPYIQRHARRTLAERRMMQLSMPSEFNINFNIYGCGNKGQVLGNTLHLNLLPIMEEEYENEDVVEGLMTYFDFFKEYMPKIKETTIFNAIKNLRTNEFCRACGLPRPVQPVSAC